MKITTKTPVFTIATVVAWIATFLLLLFIVLIGTCMGKHFSHTISYLADVYI